MRARRRGSLRWKVFGAFALVAIVAPVFAAGIGYRMLARATITQTHRRLLETAHGLAVELATSSVVVQAESQPPGGPARSSISTIVKVAADASQSTVAVLGADGRVEVAVYRGFTRQQLPTGTPQTLLARILAGKALPAGVLHSGRNAFMVAGAPVTRNGGRVGAVLAISFVRAARERNRFLQAVLLRASIVDVVLSLLLGVVLAGGITRPLQRMAQAVGAISRGDFRQRVPVRSNDEVGVLAQAFNRMAEHLDALLATRRELAAAISHELRTPLTSIEGFVAALRDQMVAPEERDHVYGIVQAEVTRLRRLIDDLFELSKLEAGQARLRLQEVQAADLVSAAAERGTVLAGPGGPQVVVEAQTPAGSLSVDPDRVAQVLGNLVQNALRHSPPDGTVTLRASPEGDGVRFEVRDTGPGIPEGEAERIFERFHTVDPSRSRPGTGTGLGLSIAREIVHAHGGQIGVDRRPGDGACFWFTLPRRPRSAPPAL
jgi:signal transduction histidine kinase